MVKVKPTASQGRITVRSNNDTTVFGIKDNLSEYYAKLAERWANSPDMVNGTDYSSKYYAEQSKASAQVANEAKIITQELIEGFDNNTQIAKDDIEQNRINSINAISDTYSTVVGDMQEKSDEVLVDIESSRSEAINSINSTKTTILNDIEFVADGEKKEIEELIDTGKDELKEAIGDVKVLTTLEIGDIGFTQMAIDETKGKRRILNGQLIIQDQYVQFTNIIKESVALNPSLACTESEWQTAVTMSKNGVCEKFVIDDEAGTIRLPKYPQYLDLTNNTSGTSAKTATVSVYGNGKSLGLWDGSSIYFSLGGDNVNNQHVASPYNAGYNKTLPLKLTDTTGNSALDADIFGLTKNASESGITGSVTIPAIAGVTSEKIKGTYFIQVATGAETEDNIINEIELNNPFSLLDYKHSEYELNNLSWLRSNGQYNSKTVYPAVYDLLLKIYNGTETKAGVSVKLSTETFTDYDFVLNTADETFRLPVKVKQKFLNAINGNMPVVGNGMTLGLTDGTVKGGIRAYVQDSKPIIGGSTNIYGQPVGTKSSSGGFTNELALGVTTDSSKSGLVAKVSQSEVSGLYLYFYVGETVQNANLINAGRIEEVVSQIKADKLDKSAVKAYITETYQNGTSWYNRYSNGWIEQGGRIVINSASVAGGTYNNATLTFIKPFSKLMSWHCQARHDRFNAGFNANVGGAVSSVDVYQVNDSTANFSNAFVIWEAKGYIA